jgi:ABC-type multidrug transport system fused ATPase/permease subunit
MKARDLSPPLPLLLARLWSHLSRRRRWQFWFVLLLMLVSAVMETVSIGAALPFLGILSVPDKVFTHPVVAGLAPAVGIESADQLVLPLTLAFAATALAAGGVRLLLLRASTRLGFATGADISTEVYRRTLYQPYSVHVTRNTGVLIGRIANTATAVVTTCLLPLLSLLSSVVIVALISISLSLISAVAASGVIVGLGAAYWVVTRLARRRLKVYSKRIVQEQAQVNKALQEGLEGIRDVLLDGTQPFYCDLFRQADRPARQAHGSITIIVGSPRYVMETLGMVVIAALAYLLSRQGGGLAAALPVLGALALGAQRLLPAVQSSYAAWAYIVGSHALLLDTLELLDQPIPAESLHSAPPPLRVRDSIQFKAVRFRYRDDGPWVVDGLDLSIPKGEHLAFVGSTGGGKSTTIDLLMGLLTPTEGSILVDGEPLNHDNLRAWQRRIAHVPQSVFLADTTIAENIALGVPRDTIDMDRVRQSARRAMISEFIEASPEGYRTPVGERGVRLSGGQRQRIGIARALYKQASVLVFDEATNALDSVTERSVVDNIRALDPGLTVVLVAHRLTTVQHCSTIVQMEGGRVVAQGTYEQLLVRSASFRTMVEGAQTISGAEAQYP